MAITQEQPTPAHPLIHSHAQAANRRLAVVALGLIVAAYLVLATFYSVVVPLGEGPDEPGHAGYAFFLARENRLPVQRFDPSQSDVPGEGHQPPLAYLLASAAVRLLPPDARTPDVVGNPRFMWNGGDQANALVHGSREYWPWQGSTLAWHLARLVSVGLGAVTVVLTFLVARQIDCRLQIADYSLRDSQSPISNLQSPMPVLAAALVAFNPQFLFTMALITNDALLVTLSALLLWLVVRTRNREPGTANLPSIVHALAVGVVLGLALITKQSAMLLVPVALWSVLPKRDWSRVWARRALAQAAAITVGAIGVAGWWYIRNRRLYGDLLGLAAFRAEFATQPFDFGSMAAWSGALAQLHDSFWARFGWMSVAPPAWAIAVFMAVEVAALLGYGRLAVRQWRTWRFDARALVTSDTFMLVLLMLLVLAWVISFARTAGLVAWQGRFLFPALPAVAILLARGIMAAGSWRLAVRPGIFLVAGVWLLLAGSCLLAIWLPFGVIGPAYTNETLPAQQAQAALGTPVYARFSDGREKGMELRGWQMAGGTTPGGAIQITLTWHALGRAGRDWQVFIQLVDAHDQVVASAEAPAKSASFPMTEWTTGDWVQGKHTLQLPPELAPGTYALHVGLFDPQSDGRRNGVYNQQGKPIGDTCNLGIITISQK